MTDLAAFLLDRIADDEAAAKMPPPGPWDRNGDIRERHVYSRPTGVTVAVAWERDAAHIARWDPARVLAECEAKRRIVEDAINDVRDARRRPGWTIPNSEVDELGRRYRAGVEHQKAQQLSDALDRTERLLRLLALPYAGHEAYDESWRP